MLNSYVFFALLYALVMGCYNPFRKKAEEKSGAEVILLLYTAVGFLCSLVWTAFGVSIEIKFIFLLALRGLALSICWLIILKVLKRVDVSIVSIMTVVSSILTLFVGVLGFKEKVNFVQFVGVLLILLGAVLINFVNKKGTKKTCVKDLFLLIISAILQSVSNIIDKYTTMFLSPFQVQFWFLLFVFFFSLIFFAIKCCKERKFLLSKTDSKNLWIYLCGIVLFVAEVFLYIAYSMPNSQMIVVTTIGKFKVVMSVILSIFMFKEKHCLKKILISLVMFLGVILVSL